MKLEARLFLVNPNILQRFTRKLATFWINIGNNNCSVFDHLSHLQVLAIHNETPCITSQMTPSEESRFSTIEETLYCRTIQVHLYFENIVRYCGYTLQKYTETYLYIHKAPNTTIRTAYAFQGLDDNSVVDTWHLINKA